MSAQPSTILVAMSGGVDSSVAAAALVDAGHRVVGATMKTFCYDAAPGPSRGCCGLDGIADARAVAHHLGVPHYVFDMEEAFTRAVIDDFVDEYVAGRTPNPCVRCNSNTKIPDMLRKARALGADAVATGHFARRERRPDGAIRIRRGVDARKDQSYFLWALPRSVIPHLLFPVGELTKAEVRSRARGLGLTTAEKPESQEICFVPTDDYTDFLEARLGGDHPALTPGRMVRADGAEVGRHGGYARYTVGQRRGLGGGRGTPLYVLQVRPERNEVVVGERDELLSERLTLGDLNWLEGAPEPGERLLAQLRHRGQAVPAVVEASRATELDLRLEEPQPAVTPGQSGVLYRDDVLVGGGRIR